MSITPHLARYLAFDLTKHNSSDEIDKLAATLADARVDLNPHQVEAALFAFRSPLSKGAILADEVGLGKTIEAGLVIAQKWAERKRRVIIVVPANLRKQWSQELMDKFYLPSIILETKSFNEAVKARRFNPFDQDTIVICSYQFARSKSAYLESIRWDLAVIDEAHRLRNVYKSGNKIGKAIKEALNDVPKVLLTATPLQNSLMELFGLVSIIDDYTFGDVKSFREQYGKVRDDTDPAVFDELKERLQPICKRTLRRQVLEYINYTERRALVEEFYPTEAEQKLYDAVTDYLQRPTLYALPPSQRQLMTLILRKLLASSSFAISGTLGGLANRLEQRLKADAELPESAVAEDYEAYHETKDEWDDEEPDPQEPLTPAQREEVQAELTALRAFETLAKSIEANSKGEKLILALEKGFEEATRRETNGMTAPRKAIIFTESTRTQLYLKTLLESRGYAGTPDAPAVILFNGSNADAQSQRIYRNWLKRHEGTDRFTGSKTADMRAALVDCFREQATVMIATEAAAEGINLQFCSLVVNYDMPWNPQRIEQRIGRCHRYGQKHDVVVVNFLNKANAADVRIYELLDQKFKLFNGVFGASDEVLGSIESGIDFEKRIAQIYQECRTPEQIQTSFDALQRELDDQIRTELQQTKHKLLENFDQEVTEKLRMSLLDSKARLNRYEKNLYELTRYVLRDYADFDPDTCSFTLRRRPVGHTDERLGGTPLGGTPLGRYQLGKNVTDAHVYRTGHPLTQWVLQQGRQTHAPTQHLTFNYSQTSVKISALEPLLGQSGWLAATVLTFDSFETQENILLTAFAEEAQVLDADLCARLLTLPATALPTVVPNEAAETLADLETSSQREWVERCEAKNAGWLLQETQKLNKWADDRIRSAEQDIRDVKARIGDLNRLSRKTTNPAEQLAIQKELNQLTGTQKKLRQQIFSVEDEIEQQRDALISQIEYRMKNQLTSTRLFTVRWTLC
ncbi:SNF2-related protein [Rudanella lutea]|uniref:SNF2-related protein n=1 Tax=Rudanella lutea TaxID=451374 RepID=UPI0003821B1C|nr:SNF2-related protein [Rudanella lutea]